MANGKRLRLGGMIGCDSSKNTGGGEAKNGGANNEFHI
jgi:hypothetical protein